MAGTDSVVMIAGAFTVHSFGEVVRDAHWVFRSRGAREPLPLPVGYCVTHKHPALKVAGAPDDLPASAVFRVSRIGSGVGAPLFEVSTPHIPNSVPHSGVTADDALASFFATNEAVAPKPRPPTGMLWGFADKVIRGSILQLPGADEVVAAATEAAKVRRSTSANMEAAASSATKAPKAAAVDVDAEDADDEPLVVALSTGAKGKGAKKPAAKKADAKAEGAPKKPRGKKAAAEAATGDAASTSDAVGECPECHVSLALPFCAATGKKHAPPAGAKKGRVSRQPTLSELAGKQKPKATAEAAAGEAVDAAPKAKRGRAKKAESATPVTVADDGNTVHTVASGDEDEDEDDKPIAFELMSAAGIEPEPPRRAARAEGGPEAAASSGIAGFFKGAKGKTLEQELREPPKPRHAQLRPLLDKGELKLAREQFEAEGGFPAASPAVQAALAQAGTYSKAQQKAFLGVLFEFLGERAKLELVKRRRQSAKTATSGGDAPAQAAAAGAPPEVVDADADGDSRGAQDAPA